MEEMEDMDDMEDLDVNTRIRYALFAGHSDGEMSRSFHCWLTGRAHRGLRVPSQGSLP